MKNLGKLHRPNFTGGRLFWALKTILLAGFYSRSKLLKLLWKSKGKSHVAVAKLVPFSKWISPITFGIATAFVTYEDFDEVVEWKFFTAAQQYNIILLGLFDEGKFGIVVQASDIRRSSNNYSHIANCLFLCAQSAFNFTAPKLPIYLIETHAVIHRGMKLFLWGSSD